MKKLFVRVCVAGALLMGIWIWRLLFPSDEAQIRQLLVDVADAASLKANSNPLIKLGGANKLAGFFTPDAVVEVEAAGIQTHALHGRDELVQAVTAARVSFDEVKVEFLDVEVVVDPGAPSAAAHLTALANVAGSSDPFVQETRIRLVKVESRWQISRVEPVRTPRLERIQ